MAPKNSVNREELFDLLDKYEKWCAGQITTTEFLGVQSLADAEKVKKRIKRIKQLFHPDSWLNDEDTKELVNIYTGEVFAKLDTISPRINSDWHLEPEPERSKVEETHFATKKAFFIKKLEKFLEKDKDFSYGTLEETVEYYIKNAIYYINSMTTKQMGMMLKYYYSTLENIQEAYLTFFDKFISDNVILIRKIPLKDKPTGKESLKEFAEKLKRINSQYSLKIILTRELEQKLRQRKANNNDARFIEDLFKTIIGEIAGRDLSQDESSKKLEDVIQQRCEEFNNRWSSGIDTYRKLKIISSTLKKRYHSLKTLCKDKTKLREAEILFNKLDCNMKKVTSFEEIYTLINKIVSMLEKIKFEGRVKPKIERYYKKVIRDESRKAKNPEKKNYLSSVSSKLSDISRRWEKESNVSAELLVELFMSVDINDEELTNRILRFLSYTITGIYIRRKESEPSNGDESAFYTIEYDGLNKSKLIINQLSSKGEVKTCPIEVQELFDFYFPLDELVIRMLKYSFKSSESSDIVMCDDACDGYFILQDNSGYSIFVGENYERLNQSEVSIIDESERVNILNKIAEFVRNRLSSYKKSIHYGK